MLEAIGIYRFTNHSAMPTTISTKTKLIKGIFVTPQLGGRQSVLQVGFFANAIIPCKLLTLVQIEVTMGRRLTMRDQPGLVIFLIDVRLEPTANLGSPLFSRPPATYRCLS
jgi:hypothetical protein